MMLATGCKDIKVDGHSPDVGPTASDGLAVDGQSVSPLANPEGTKPGLAPITSDADKTKARQLIERVTTKGRGPKTGYDRDEFGYAWTDSADGIPLAHNGCDTRNDLIKRDGQDLRFRSGSGCVVISMTLRDPYTATTIAWRKTQATAVQIDHVVSVAATI
jgi:hypothetical protein